MNSKCFQPTAKAQSRRLPVESAMPGTTLQTIELKAFATTGSLFGECSYQCVLVYGAFIETGQLCSFQLLACPATHCKQSSSRRLQLLAHCLVSDHICVSLEAGLSTKLLQ